MPPVATNLVTGFLGAGKTTFIQSLLAQRPANEQWAVLLTEGGMARLSQDVSAALPVTIREVAAGCICCTGRVTLQVAITRLLRATRPDRLLIEVSALGHPSRALEVLRDPWLSRAIELRNVVCVVDPAQFASARVRRIESYDDTIARADVIALSDAGLPSEGAAVRHVLGALAPTDRPIIEMQRFPLALLDRASPISAA